MRKSFRGLSALVRNQLKHDPLSGQYFVFVNRRKTQMKMLYFNRTGYCLGPSVWSRDSSGCRPPPQVSEP